MVEKFHPVPVLVPLAIERKREKKFEICEDRRERGVLLLLRRDHQIAIGCETLGGCLHGTSRQVGVVMVVDGGYMVMWWLRLSYGNMRSFFTDSTTWGFIAKPKSDRAKNRDCESPVTTTHDRFRGSEASEQAANEVILFYVKQAANVKLLLFCGVGCQVQALRAVEHHLNLEKLYVLGTNCAFSLFDSYDFLFPIAWSNCWFALQRGKFETTRGRKSMSSPMFSARLAS
ncbi:hypothetical protein F8388_012123 [Cannabis sativa]|uniref:Uncharacterized protein n=1 Tax=Cannabis sativa TaxID=3483 RepID=A0A7J6GE18_CANSA|nr:hypothetical protein F8388_012123 [Cannabis sativa]